MQIPKDVRQGLGDFDAPPPDPEIDRPVSTVSKINLTVQNPPVLISL